MSNKNTLTLIPMMSVHPDKICIYNELHWEPFKPDRSQSSNHFNIFSTNYDHLLNSKRNAQGKVSKIARRKIIKSINYLITTSTPKKATSQKTGRQFNFKIAFITLTLPSKQIHSDKEIKRELLNSFLGELTKYHQVKRYVWRAEKQKNGNIHFHILIDKFVHWNDIRNRWNRILRKLGYVQRYQANMKKFYKDGFKLRNDLIQSWSETRQRAAYRLNLETGFNSPNTTDIHSIIKIRNLTAYFVKYMTKNPSDENNQDQGEDGEQLIEGRIWGASKNLSNIKGAQLVVDSGITEELEKIQKKANCKIIHDTYYSVYFVDFKELKSVGADTIFNEFVRYLAREFDYNFQYDLTG